MPRKPSTHHFDLSASVYARFRQGYSPHALAYLRERCQISPQTRLLDLACGPGTIFSEFLGETRSTIGLDGSPGMLAEAAKLSTGNPGHLLVRGRAEQLPLPNASCDLVTIGQAIHWLDLGQLLLELARVIRLGGWLAVISKYPSPAEPARFRIEHIIRRIADRYDRSRAPELTFGSDIGNLLGLEGMGFTDYQRVVFSWRVATPRDAFLEGWRVRFNEQHFPPEARKEFIQSVQALLDELAEDGLLREVYFDYVLTARRE